MKTKEEYLEDSMRYRATDLNSMSETARILRAMQEYAKDYYQNELRDELILFCCDCNIKLPDALDYIDLVDGYLSNKNKPLKLKP